MMACGTRMMAGPYRLLKNFATCRLALLGNIHCRLAWDRQGEQVSKYYIITVPGVVVER